MVCPNTSPAVSWVQAPFSPPAPSPQRRCSQLVVDAELWCVHGSQAGCFATHLFLLCFFPGKWDEAQLGLCGVHHHVKSPPKPAQPASWLRSCPCKLLGAPRRKKKIKKYSNTESSPHLKLLLNLRHAGAAERRGGVGSGG